MIIAIDASRANKTKRSGIEWYSYYLLKQLYQLDDQNRYFLYTPEKLIDDLKPPPSNFTEKVLKWPLKKLWTLGRFSLEMLFNKPDILFVPSHTFPLIGAKKNIITWHDVGYKKFPETYTKWELWSLNQGNKRAVKIADKIITISHFSKKEILKFYKIDPEKISVIYLGCNHDLWQPAPADAVRDFLQRNSFKAPYFVYLGRLALRKNIVGLIRIYNRFREKYHKPHQLILIGSAEPQQDEINQEIQASPFKDEIKKMGWLPTEQLPILLSGASGFVFPTIYEGFGLPAVEAMACGCPVIASNSGALPEIIDEAGLLTEAHDVDGFAQNMIKVIEDSEFRQDLISKGLQRSKEFSWEKCAQETLKILQS
ncbi:glycosyltransferase family 4 protein [Patescibacteria group bacterium]|nr:glycosyltransferase family 4 protein [Patescibacteria group bacterium]